MDHRDVYLNYIQGEWKQGGSGQWDTNRNPARPVEVLGKCTRSNAIDVDKAVEAATRVQLEWARRSRPQRGAVIEKAARVLRAKGEQHAKVITKEQGKNLAEAKAEIQQTITYLEFIAAESRRAIGQVIPSDHLGTMIYTRHLPLGTVGIITPWSDPILTPATAIAPALLEGNTLVFKPSSLTPASAASLVRLFEEAGLPGGVLNLVYGPGPVIGAAIVKHPKIPAISFAGSREVGREVLTEGSRRLAKVQLQASGSAALIVLEGGDLDAAVDAAIQGAFGCSGQRNSASSRVLVENALLDSFTRKVLDRVRTLKTGDGMVSPEHLGPLVDENAQNAVMELIELGKSEGARILCGGERVGAPGPETGYYVAPTLFDQVRPEMQLVRKEAYGPVLSLIGVANLDEAIQAVNLWDNAVSVSIYSRDIEKLGDAGSRIRAPQMNVNLPTFSGEPQCRSATEFFRELRCVRISSR